MRNHCTRFNEMPLRAGFLALLFWLSVPFLTFANKPSEKVVFGENATLACGVSWTTTNSSITISGLTAGHVIFKLFGPNWTTEYDCFDNCTDPLTISGLTSGATYYVSYQLYTSNWQQTCNELEPVRISGSNPELADLRLADMKSPASADAGAVPSFTIDLINSGTSTADGAYVIGFYLSTNNVLDNSDTQVGVINTGNTPVGTINNVPAAITVPAGTMAGDYYLIAKTDINNSIAESNEGNNTVVKSISITQEPIGDECGFLKPAGTYAGGQLNWSSAETGDEYLFVGTGYNSNTQEDRTVTNRIDKNGNFISTSDVLTPRPASDRVNVDGSIAFPNLRVQKINANSSIAWTKDISLVTNNILSGFASVSARKISDGWLLAGTHVSNDGGPTQFYQLFIKLDENGNVLNQDNDNVFPGNNVTSYGPAIPNSTGGYAMNLNNGSELAYVGIDANGDVSWYEETASDFPSNTVAGFEASADGQFIFVANRNNDQSYIEKININTGVSVYRANISELYAAATNGYHRVQRFFGLLLTSDGGVVAGYRYQDPINNTPFSYAYGKIDVNGNMLWFNNLEDVPYIFRPVLNTADGGFLFVNVSSGSLTSLKVTSTGSLSPACGEGGPTTGTPLPCDLNYTFSNGTLNISGSGLNAGHVIIKVFGPSWNTLFRCLDDCGSSISVDIPINGMHHISIATYDSNWQPSCSELASINLGAGAGPLSRKNQNILHFEVLENGRQAELNWMVNNSFKTSSFVIERSVDGDVFSTLTEVSSATNSDQETSHIGRDVAPLQGFNYYRIKQIFSDGQFRYSNTQQLFFDLDLDRVNLFPNPAQEEVFLQLKEFAGMGAEIHLYDQLGQLKQRQELDAVVESPLRLDLRGLPSGIYLVRIKISGRKLISKKMLISQF